MQFEICYNLLATLQTISNTYTQMAWAQSCANYVQHIEGLSRAACRVKFHVVWRDSSAIKFDRVEIAFIWVFILLAEPLTNEGGEETGVPGENPW